MNKKDFNKKVMEKHKQMIIDREKQIIAERKRYMPFYINGVSLKIGDVIRIMK